MWRVSLLGRISLLWWVSLRRLLSLFHDNTVSRRRENETLTINKPKNQRKGDVLHRAAVRKILVEKEGHHIAVVHMMAGPGYMAVVGHKELVADNPVRTEDTAGDLQRVVLAKD